VTLASIGTTSGSAVSVTDASGAATVSSGGVSIPVLLSDPSTGGPIQGVNVALGLPSSQQGLARLFISDPQGRYPDQFLTLTAAQSGGAATTPDATKKLASAASTPVSLSVQNGCPSSLPANITVQTPIVSTSVPGPPPPSALDAMNDADLSALNNFASSVLGTSINIGADQQLGFASASDCASGVWNWVKPEAANAVQDYLAIKTAEYVTGLALVPVEVFRTISGVNVSKMSSALGTCENWTSGAIVRAINMKNQRMLSATFPNPPSPSSVVQQPVATQNGQSQPVPSSLCFVSPGILGGDFAGTTDPSGETVVDIPPGNCTLGVTAPGYQPTTQNITIPSAGSQPLSPLTMTLPPGGSGGGGGTTFTGSLDASTTVSTTCTWQLDLTGQINVTVSGGGTASNPYTGTFAVTGGQGTFSVLTCSVDAIGFRFSFNGPVAGSLGYVTSQGSFTVQDATWGTTTWAFANGVLSGNTLIGTLTMDTVPGFDEPAVQTLTLNKTP